MTDHLETRDLPPMSHGVMQVIARRAGVDLLHVKGPAVDDSLLQQHDGGPVARHSTDADVLVRPKQIPSFVRAARRHGWRMVTGFEDGSPFTHAATLWHDHLGYVDIHREFPGIEADPARAFDVLWRDRHLVAIGHIDCAVPSMAGQRLVLLLHAARSRGAQSSDINQAWTNADQAQRDELLALADELKAEVALAAATGRLGEFTHARSHDLWAYFSGHEPSSRLREWQVRLKAERSWLKKARALVGAITVNRGHLEMELGHRPSNRELAHHQRIRIQRLRSEVSAAIARRTAR